MADPRTTAAKLTAQLRSTFGDELRSVVVFGSVPRGESIPGVSDLNLLVLLESMSAANLVRTAPLLMQWIRQGNTPPYIYSWEEWSGMRETFAIEIADMNDAREVLWGADPIATDAVMYTGLRLQAERETRDTLLQIRLRLMVNSHNAAEIGALLLSGVPSLTAYMRAALRLTGEAPGLATRAVIERTARLIDADASPMLTCHDARHAHTSFQVPIGDALVERYLEFVHAQIDHLHRLPTERPVQRADTPAQYPSSMSRTPGDQRVRAEL
jgi:predicted nucleotidyltransferase